MAVNKVVINRDGIEEVLIDITGSTVVPETLAVGEIAYNKRGEEITGTMISAASIPIAEEAKF